MSHAISTQQYNRKLNSQKDALYDWQLVSCVTILIGLGLVMVASASISIADPLGKADGPQLYYFWRQVVALVIGITAGLTVLKIPLSDLKRLRYLFLFVTIALLIAVLTPLGTTANGASRWIDLGVYALQASEIAKLLVVIYLAGYMEQHLEQVRTSFSGLYKPIIVLIVICGLLLMEPDFGTSVLLFSTMLGLLFIAGIPLIRIIVWGSLAVIVLSVFAVMSPYRMQRLMTFMDPWADPYNTGFQLTQALIAIGRGEWSGVGLGNSVQKLFYLPEAHTDFIFSVYAEELGLLGCLALIAVFTFFIWRVFTIAAEAEKKRQYFAAYLAYGFSLLIGMQAFFNIGVNMGVLPTKGLTLPFISYGGNSLIMMCVATALILRVDFENRLFEDDSGNEYEWEDA